MSRITKQSSFSSRLVACLASLSRMSSPVKEKACLKQLKKQSPSRGIATVACVSTPNFFAVECCPLTRVTLFATAWTLVLPCSQAGDGTKSSGGLALRFSGVTGEENVCFETSGEQGEPGAYVPSCAGRGISGDCAARACDIFARVRKRLSSSFY